MLACSSSQATMTDALGGKGVPCGQIHLNMRTGTALVMPRHQGEQTPRARVQAARHTGTWVATMLLAFGEKVLEKGQLHRPHLAKKRSCATLEPKSIAGAKVRPPYHGGFGHDECVTAHRPSAEDSRCCRRPRSHTRAHYSRPQMTLRTAMVATSLAPSQSPESSEAGTGTTACRPGPTSPRRRSSG